MYKRQGKIRAMIDDKGNRVKVAGPSTPVEILGLNDVPNAGEIIMAADSEKEARSTAETFISEGRKKLLDDTKHKVSLDALFEQIQAGNMKELNIIIKADVQGSVEAVKSSLVRLSNDEVVVKVIHGGVGKDVYKRQDLLCICCGGRLHRERHQCLIIRNILFLKHHIRVRYLRTEAFLAADISASAMNF